MARRIFVKAKPLAKEEKIEKVGESNFIVWVKEPPAKGLANKAIIKLISFYFKVPIFRINFISGFSSKQKVFEIE